MAMQMFIMIKIVSEKKCWDSLLRNVLNRPTIVNKTERKKRLEFFPL